MHLHTEYVTFPERKNRSEFVARRFADLLQGSVLDVGCYEAPLKELIRSVPYIGIDIAGKPDKEIDLEKSDRLPFKDNEFQCVLCIDVLEHLDNLHAVFAELVRVTQRHLIVSLPNCWCDARRPIERGVGHFGHYGLPTQRPQDRHKWFISLTEARQFVEAKTQEFNMKLEDMFVTEKPRRALVRWLRRIRYPGERYHNRYSQTLWVVLRKARHGHSIEQSATPDGNSAALHAAGEHFR